MLLRSVVITLYIIYECLCLTLCVLCMESSSLCICQQTVMFIEQLTFTLGPSLYAGKPVAQNCTNPCTRTNICNYTVQLNCQQMLHKNTTLLKQNMKIFNKEAKVLVPNKKSFLSQKVFFSYILLVGFGRAARTLLFRLIYTQNEAFHAPSLPPIASLCTVLLLSIENPRKIPSNPPFPVSPCPIQSPLSCPGHCANQ